MSEESFNDGQILEIMHQKMKDDGMIDQIKLQIRKQFVDQLKDQPQRKKKREFWEKVADCFIVDYLKVYHLESTISLFLPECSLEQKDILSTQELLSLCGLGVRDYSEFTLQLSDQSMSAMERRFQVEKQDHSTQTQNDFETYEERMKKIEREYLNKLDYFKLTDTQSIEERVLSLCYLYINQMNSYRLECDKRYKLQMVADLDRIRVFEIEQVRLEERTRYNELLRGQKAQIDAEAHKRMQEVKEKEEQAINRVKGRLENLEKAYYEKRQQLQKEMDQFEKIKLKFERHKCIESEEVQTELKEAQALKKELSGQIKEYNESSKALNQQMQKQTQMVSQFWEQKREMEKYNQPSQQFKNDDKKDEDMTKIYKESCESLTKQRQYLQEENEQLRQEFHDLQYNFENLKSELTSCREELNKVKDDRDVERNNSDRLEAKIKLIERLQNEG